MSESNTRTVAKLLRQQAALASFGSFAFREPLLTKILSEAARICAVSMDVPFCKICRYREAEADLRVEAGCGWHDGVVGRVISQANESSPQGRAYVTGKPVIIHDLHAERNMSLPSFYQDHGIVSTIDVLIPAIDRHAYGVLEIDSPVAKQYDAHDIDFLTGFANVLAEAVAAHTRVKAIEALLASRDLLAEEMNHRVRNNLQMITMMLDNYARTTADDAGRDGVDQIARRVTTMAQVYDSLLGVGLSRTVDLADYLRALCLKLPGIQAKRTEAVNIVFTAEPVLLSLDDVTTLGMAVAELVTNSYGHAFPNGRGTITVTLSQVGPDNATIIVRDDGAGFKEKADSDRRGVGLVRRLLKKMDGTLEVDSRDGTSWTLKFAVPTMPANVNIDARRPHNQANSA